MVGVVVLEDVKDAQPLGLQSGIGFAVHISACGVRRAVRAVGADGEDRRSGEAGDTGGCRQGKLLIASALAVACEVYDGLAAHDEGEAFFGILMVAGDFREHGARVPCGAAEAGREHLRAISQPAAFGVRGQTELADAAGHVGFHVREGLGRFLAKQLLHLRAQGQVILAGDFLGLLAGGGVRIGGAGGDHVQRIADDIRKDDGEDMRGPAELREAAAFHGGEALAHGVHLGDLRAAGQQLAGQAGELIRGDQRLFEERGAAAGEQEQDGILFGEAGDGVNGRLRPDEGILVRDRMPCLEDADVRDVALAVVVFGDHNAAVDAAAQGVAGSLGHLPGRLAGGDQDDPAAAEMGALQRLGNRCVRHSGRQRCLNDLIGIVAKRHGILPP